MEILKLTDCSAVTIRYKTIQTIFGEALVAQTDTGVCYMGYGNDLEELTTRFKGATFIPDDSFEPNFNTLHLRGTEFQLQVWNELIKIPQGEFTTYSDIAKAIARPRAYRAVGTAVGRNPVWIVVPCHRVITCGGGIGGYYWGTELKQRILEAEHQKQTLIKS